MPAVLSVSPNLVIAGLPGGSVNFADALATNTLATFSSTGNYVLRLTATDSALIASAQVTVAVRTPSMNEAPTVNAGTDRIVGLTNSLALHGTVRDDGLPQGAALTVQWSAVSGPGQVSFANSSTTNTQATFAAVGTYVLRLTASDSGLSASDDVTVTVYPYNLPPVVNAGLDQEIIVPDPALLRSDAAQPTNQAIFLSRSLTSEDRWNPGMGQPGLTSGSGGLIGVNRGGMA
jgi:PKD repeat protein